MWLCLYEKGSEILVMVGRLQHHFFVCSLIIEAIILSVKGFTLDDPPNPTCSHVSGLDWCSMVDYSAIVGDNDLTGEQFDLEAKEMYNMMEKALSRFDCSQRYSYHDCESCRDAYKYWACSVKFQKCGGDDYTNSTMCYVEGVGVDDCRNSNWCCKDGRRKTCLSLCEDVVRKCPYILGFSCPKQETRDYSGHIGTCNKLDRVNYPPDTNGLWPASFRSGAESLFIGGWRSVVAPLSVAAALCVFLLSS